MPPYRSNLDFLKIKSLMAILMFQHVKNNVRKITLLFLMLSIYSYSCRLNAQNSIKEFQIEGNIQLDSIWNKKLYLSHILDFSKMYTMSKGMIIAESEIDSLGYFKFNIDFLPIEDNLYRIHVAKKGASEASIIIGGKDENHFFLIANKTSNIKILNRNKIFNDIAFLNDDKNKIIAKIDGIVKFMDSTNFSATRVKSEFVTNAFNEQLRQIADTCSNPIVSLYALQKSKFENDIKNNTEYYQNFVEKWKDENSVYFKNLKSNIPEKKNNFDNRIFIGVGIFLSFTLGFIISEKRKNSTTKNSRLLKTLSVQEHKIHILLKEGKSNKEISEEFNIGISTVKSHISSIYSKLNVKSRKEIINQD